MIKSGFIILMAVFFTLSLSAIFKNRSNLFLNSPKEQTSISTDTFIILIAGKQIKIDIADTEEKRSRGLSGKKSLPENAGMLFVFGIPAQYSFWMKDMRFSIDIIWIDETKKIVAVSENISPDTYPASFSPSDPVKYVLEVNAGWTQKNGIVVGDNIELIELPHS
ncbi:MAG: DUF192 domain-containing protein [Patescibacteria group bacterium]